MTVSSLQQTIVVNLPGDDTRSYQIITQSGLLQGVGRLTQEVCPAVKALIITDETVAQHYLSTVRASYEAAGMMTFCAVLPPGETSKSLLQAEKIYKLLLEHHITRQDLVVGLGGGVLGDLAGFVASTWHRGVALVHIPTTLVAQVDSAIGGKTAVNLDTMKNMVGTFYQPRLVLMDPDTLTTLPPREFAAGMAEVIKYTFIETSCTGQTGFFDWLLHNAQAIQAILPQLLHRCAGIKADVVMKDEKETLGLRHFLNLGHTFGHAYESLSQYGLLHGEAVLIGTHLALSLAVRLNQIDPALRERFLHLLSLLGLKDILKHQGTYPPDALLSAMRQDKKNSAGNRIRLILPQGEAGHVLIRDDVPDHLLLELLAETAPV